MSISTSHTRDIELFKHTNLTFREVLSQRGPNMWTRLKDFKTASEAGWDINGQVDSLVHQGSIISVDTRTAAAISDTNSVIICDYNSLAVVSSSKQAADLFLSSNL